MGTKYATETVSGYNATPPSDDGSTSESNKVKWATIKEKLPDPLKTAIEGINSKLVTAFDYSARSVTSADSTVASDHMRTLEVPSSVTSTFTISLGDAASMANGYIVRIRNSSGVSITIGRATVGDTIDGSAANKTLPAGASAAFAVNEAGNGYYAISEAGYSISSLIDAKGDLIVGTAPGVAGTLAVGSNNLALVADSSQTGGMKWGSAQHWPSVTALRSAGATFTVTSAHRGNLILSNADSGGNLTIDADASGLGAGFVFAVQLINAAAGTTIIDDSTASANFHSPQAFNANNITLAAGGDIAVLQSDGANWRSLSFGVQATEISPGLVELATNAEALAGVDTARAVTSSGLASGKSLSSAGYMKFSGGLIVQWGNGATSPGGSVNGLPITFPTQVFSVVATTNNGLSAIQASVVNTSQVSLTSTSGTPQAYYITLGF